MTDRVKGLLVILKNDIREDDIQPWVEGVSLLKGVIDVQLIKSDISDSIEKARIKREFWQSLMKWFDNL